MDMYVNAFIVVYLMLMLSSLWSLFRGKPERNADALRVADDNPRMFKVLTYFAALILPMNLMAVAIAFTVPGVPDLTLIVLALLIVRDVNDMRRFLNIVDVAAERCPNRAATLALRGFRHIRPRSMICSCARTVAWATVAAHALL